MSKEERINKLISKGKIDEALELANIEDTEYLFEIGILFGRKEKHAVAEKIFSRIVQLDSNLAKAWSGKGVALGYLGKYDEAIKCFDKAIEINPNHYGAWSNKGVALDHLGKHQEAIKCFDKAIEINPNYDNAWSNKGVALGYLGKHQEAIKCFDKAIEINPNYDNACYNKGLSLGKLGKYDEAIKFYDKAIEINPNHYGAWSDKGVALGNLGKHQEAIKCFDKAIEINPNYDNAWSNKGVALDHLGKYDEAIKFYDKTIEINPNYDNAWFNKGVALGYLGKHQEAIKCFDKAIEINPNYDKAYGNLGITLLDLSQYEGAIENLRKAKDLFLERKLVNDADKAAGYELWAKGLKNWSKGEYEKAISHFNEAISIFRALNLEVISNSLELISEMVPLDRQFMDALNSRNLFELREKSSKICKGITELIDKFKKKPITEDAKEILVAKADCFIALCSALEFERPKLEALDRARKIFEKRGFETSVVAVNSLDNFIRGMSKHKNLEEIPEDVVNILLQVLQSSHILDGALTREIPIGEYYKPTPTERVEEPEIIYQFIEDPKKEWIRVCLVQLDFSCEPTRPPKEFGYILKEKERIKKNVFKALQSAKENKVDIICFPELSIAEEWIEEAKNQYPNITIVFGTYYKNGFNTCPIIVKGQDYYIQKLNPSPHFEKEVIKGRHMKKGKKIFVFETKFGKFVVLICIDYRKEVHRILHNPNKKIRNVDFIIVPQYNENVKSFQEHGNQACQEDNFPYITQVNAWKVFDREVGGTCVIGMEHKDALKRYKMEGLKPDDNIDYKLIEAKGERIMIIDLDIKRKGVPLPASGPKMKLILSTALG